MHNAYTLPLVCQCHHQIDPNFGGEPPLGKTGMMLALKWFSRCAGVQRRCPIDEISKGRHALTFAESHARALIVLVTRIV